MRRVPPLLLLLTAASCQPPAPPEDDLLGEVGAFRYEERGGQVISNDDLRGKVWVASFVFTRCTGGCPQVTATMQGLQKDLADLAGLADVRLVTFTIDPEGDDPARLKSYADHFGADPARWLFLRGPEADVHRLMRETFHLHVQKNPTTARNPGTAVDHAFKLAVVDRRGRIRGYFDGLPDKVGDDPEADFRTNLQRLRDKVKRLVQEPQ